MKAATALARGMTPDPALAERAVREAMDKAGLEHPETVLLYLTSEFAHDPRPALSAAARAARCTQVSGCAAAGVFTEEDWVLDAPAAAALVLGEGVSLRAASAEGPAGDADFADAGPILTLSAPNAVDGHWLAGGGRRFGGVAGDATGQGPYSVWAQGRMREDGRGELAVRGARLRVGVSQGIRPLTHPAEVRRVQGHDVMRVGGDTALAGLARELPLSVRAPERIPTHLLMAGVTYGEPLTAMEEGRFHLLPVMGVNPRDQSVSVAGLIPPGVDLFWAMRQPQAAEHDMRAMLARLCATHAGVDGCVDDGAEASPPAFALMFPCLGRGPWFYGGKDRDLDVIKRAWPGLPLIGFYGNGEIAHLDGANRLLQYSVVLGLGYAGPEEPAGGADV